MMEILRWLTSGSAIKGPRGFLLRLLRRSIGGPVPVAPKNGEGGAEEAYNKVTLKDDARLRLVATCNLVTTVTYSELIAPLSALTRPATDAEVNSAMDYLLRLQRESPRVFPLELYWQTVRRGLSDSTDWLHFGSGSLQPGLDLFLTSREEQVSSADDLPMNFAICCSRRDVSALP